MNVKKAFLSFFLLAIYSLGFLHEVIPHCHAIAETFEHGFAHHNIHQHGEKANDASFSHLSHSDNSLLEYVSCLLGQVEHPTSADDQHYLSSKVNQAKLSQKFAVLVAQVPGLTNFLQTPSSTTPFGFVEFEILYDDPLPDTHPLRGPPAIC